MGTTRRYNTSMSVLEVKFSFVPTSHALATDRALPIIVLTQGVLFNANSTIHHDDRFNQPGGRSQMVQNSLGYHGAIFRRLTQTSSSSRSVTPTLKNNSLTGAISSPGEVGHKRNPSTGSSNLLFQNIEEVETASQISLETGSVHSDRQTNEPRLMSIASPVLENSGVNQMRNTEGAILKHVLKDM
ncbi:hypothetical protein EVAR_79182_1 [Eumeta japonica]|uniref:Uncharacterized protein n=1 Tax=Eumeta variegata TaxID=151549 RepID=A0A4C1UT38_EUMVA|nr:hypothetical protein EVAR_79182_1 [Eumeta japonica]